MKGLALPVLFFWAVSFCALPSSSWSASDPVQLPKPSITGKMPVEQAMARKKSVREFSNKPLSLAEVSQLLWAANGNLPMDAISGATTKVIPSAGGLYPLEVFVVCGKGSVTGLPEGVYQYNPAANSLVSLATGDNRMIVASACWSQMWMAKAPIMIVIGGVFARTMAKYREQGTQYVWMEAGNSSQNVFLQAESLGLKIATVGAFQSTQFLATAAKLPTGVIPLLVMPAGK